jgi:hypothetical protein
MNRRDWWRVIGWPKPAEIALFLVTTTCAVVGGVVIGSVLAGLLGIGR